VYFNYSKPGERLPNKDITFANCEILEFGEVLRREIDGFTEAYLTFTQIALSYEKDTLRAIIRTLEGVTIPNVENISQTCPSPASWQCSRIVPSFYHAANTSLSSSSILFRPSPKT